MVRIITNNAHFKTSSNVSFNVSDPTCSASGHTQGKRILYENLIKTINTNDAESCNKMCNMLHLWFLWSLIIFIQECKIPEADS
jgi:hypothetical protein